jgi:hypothetical protein
MYGISVKLGDYRDSINDLIENNNENIETPTVYKTELNSQNEKTTKY